MSLFSEISPQLLEEGRRVRFQATGGSMRPFIRGGDMVTVEGADISAARIGDVVFCRHRGGFQVHRVIRRFKKDAFPVLIVKGDALPGCGEIVFSEDFLGRVTLVERAGRRWKLDSFLGAAANGAALFFSYVVFLTHPFLLFLRRSVRYFARGIVLNLQKAAWYRKGVRPWVIRGILIDRLREDDLYALACFYEYDRYPNFLELTAALRKDIVALDAESHYIVAKREHRITGSVWVGPLFEESPDQDVWWVTGLLVGWPY